MNLNHVSKVASFGLTLNMEERFALKASILKLRANGAGAVKFWGKINGTSRDYLICCSADTSSTFPAKNFYYCTSGDYELKKLVKRALTGKQLALAQKLQNTHAFVGDPAKPIGPEGEEEEKEAEEGVTPADMTYREIHQLAFVVWSVDNATSIIPRGSYCMASNGALVPNRSFSGLSPQEATNISSYYHLRPPQARAAEWENKTGAAKMENILDQVGASRPASKGPSPVGAWAAGVNNTGDTVNLRSLEYPGYFFFHDLEDGSYGGAYFGDGKFNRDLGFML